VFEDQDKSAAANGNRAEASDNEPVTAADERSEAETRPELEALGRRQQTREASRFGSEPLWLHNARGIYRELGEDLDALSSGEHMGVARRDQATGRLRKLSESLGVRGGPVQKAQPALIKAIMRAIDDASRMQWTHAHTSSGDKATFARMKFALVDQQLGERFEKEQFATEQLLTEKLVGVLDHWHDCTPRSRKWPLLHELLKAVMPDPESVPNAESLRTTFQKRRTTADSKRKQA
jgi:hypothetical protein